jgi:hypothetical protein
MRYTFETLTRALKAGTCAKPYYFLVQLGFQEDGLYLTLQRNVNSEFSALFLTTDIERFRSIKVISFVPKCRRDGKNLKVCHHHP